MLFVDLVGFAALTEAHGDDHAADLAQRFRRELNERLPEGAEDFKMLSNACLVRSDDADAAVRLALSLTGELGARHAFPAVRAGMHTGSAVRRGADWFGAAVNTAARTAYGRPLTARRVTFR